MEKMDTTESAESAENAENIDVSIDQLIERAHIVALPMRVSFRGVRLREAMLIEGTRRWCEWSPFLEYGPEESSRWLRSALGYGFGWQAGGVAFTPGADPTPEGAAPTPEQEQFVQVNATIPAMDVSADPDVIDRLMQRYPGCTTVKIKVAERGQNPEWDVARVRAVRQWFADNGIPHPKVRLDANGGWTVPEAIDAITSIAGLGPLDYVEQPCATVAELAQVRTALMQRGLFVRIAADESIRKSSDPLRAVEEVIDAGACDVAVLKVPPLGGIDQLVRIAEAVAPRGVAITVSSALDTAVGIGAGLEAAARLPRNVDDDGMIAEPQAAGLATGTLFEADVAPRPIVNGRIAAGPVVPDPAVLEEYAIQGERRDWWLQRLRDAHAYL